jgi:predicted nuclease with TOPRIM domain
VQELKVKNARLDNSFAVATDRVKQLEVQMALLQEDFEEMETVPSYSLLPGLHQ